METAASLAPNNIQILKLLAHTYQQAGKEKESKTN